MNADERLEMLDRMLAEPAERGLILRTADDEVLDGRRIGLDGREIVSFGSCSYLGLEMDDRLREGVCDAVARYGTQFSSSRTYLSAPPYAEIEELLDELFGGHVLLAPSTTLGHLSTLPVVVGADDAVVLDQQVHHSVQMAANQVRLQGAHVEMIRHSRLDLLEERLEALRSRHRRIWYLADGVYSMFADLAPADELAALMDRHEQLHLYVDDSHGMSWAGRHGRGQFLARLPMRDRLIVAASLNKAFAAAGGAFVFPDAETRRKVKTCGPPMIFSGPIQPPMLGAALASARIHLSPEIGDRQTRLRDRIRLFNALSVEHGLPLVSDSEAPIRCVGLGLPRASFAMAERLLDEGMYVNVASFPAVPLKKTGIRIPLTLHHTDEDVRRLVDAIARHLPEALAEAGERLDAVSERFGLEPRRPEVPSQPAPRPHAATGHLHLQHETTIDAFDAREWDRLLGGRGSFGAEGLRVLEATFRGSSRPADNWDWHYFVVRDAHGAPVLATFFTAALWKDDMLADPRVSAVVEARRRGDPSLLTSRTLGMGSLLTEGDHLHLDRSKDWRGALSLLVEALAETQAASGTANIVLRDLPGDDAALDTCLLDAGFVRARLPDSYVSDGGFGSDRELLEHLSYRARRLGVRETLPAEAIVDLEILHRGGRVPRPDELLHLHGLYRNVKERQLALNTFELPQHLLGEMLRSPSWELLVLTARPGTGGPADGRAIAFGACYVGDEHYVPVVAGVDRRFIGSHRGYRLLLWHVIRRARAHRALRILWGMGAGIEKRRVGARPVPRFAYLQAADHYSADVLEQITGDAFAASGR